MKQADEMSMPYDFCFKQLKKMKIGNLTCHCFFFWLRQTKYRHVCVCVCLVKIFKLAHGQVPRIPTPKQEMVTTRTQLYSYLGHIMFIVCCVSCKNLQTSTWISATYRTCVACQHKAEYVTYALFLLIL